ncbi:unnamed protein product [Amoebophrya sp. A25]|nr:unnamed protein product [Amoebophrya sp. A25]|eukprot:GSA25T00014724001.1
MEPGHSSDGENLATVGNLSASAPATGDVSIAGPLKLRRSLEEDDDSTRGGSKGLQELWNVIRVR